MKALIPAEMIEKKSLLVRGEKVMLDADLAEIYGVTTKRLNEQAKRNADRFPAGFAFQLTSEEWESLKALKNESNRSQIATGSQEHRDPRFLPAAAPRPAPGLLWFAGNAETIAGIWPLLAAWRPAEFGVLILDYRGYGTSGGRPTEAGLYRDGEAAWDALVRRPDIDPGRITVYGRSLGSAVALHVATVRPARAVVLESPFSTGAELRRTHYPFLPGALMRLELDNAGRAARLDVPLLVFHGADDRIVPPAMGRAVAAAGRGTFHLIPGADHNETFAVGGTWYRDTLTAFLREVVR